MIRKQPWYPIVYMFCVTAFFSTVVIGFTRLKEDGRVVAYAVPIEGRGFWAPIRGMIGVKADRKTITGIAFYEQNETPGLGAEIAKSPFRDQFRGKEISPQDKPISMRRPGETLGKSEVHAVTGATQTSTRLEGIINASLKQWQTQMAAKSEGGGQ
jgi:Na+-transporting NADH:ubiquinone oxidoreductase subunit C